MTVIKQSAKNEIIPRSLVTRKGAIAFPAYIPVTTFGKKYPLDNLIRPYLPRLAPAVMVSHYYAKQMTAAQLPNLPMLVDSGGFAALFENSTIVKRDRLGVLEIKNSETDEVEIIHPKEVLEFQEQVADVAFTLDFPIPPKLDKKEAKRRQDLTIANALWAINNRRRRDMPLYACVQAWDAKSARACAKAYVGQGFEGIAIGGLVPRSQDLPLVLAIVEAVREEIGDLPLHVFGLGKPAMVKELYRVGVDSVDSSSYVKYAADGKLWSNPSLTLIEPTPTDRLHLALHNLSTATGCALPLASSEQLLSLFRSQFR